jgi:endonuclease/exonuclease/phosphatase family metal-dependent hydrolase
MTELRVVTYNIRSLRDDTTAVVRVLRRLEPDVVCLQETPRFLQWRSKLAGLARRSGLLYVVGGRGSGSTALLSRLRVDVAAREERLLSKSRGLHQRGVAIARLRMHGVEFAVASLHASLDPAERGRHLMELRALLDDYADVPQVVAGDLNETPDGPVWRDLARSHTDAWAAAPAGGELTFSALRPRRRIDAVLVSPTVEVLSAGVPEDADSLADYPRATDHRPVLAELRLPSG